MSAGYIITVGAWFAAQKLPIRRRGQLNVFDGVLLLDGVRVLDRSDISLILPKNKPDHALSIARRGARRWSPLTIILESASDAKALISDLKWDAAQAVAEYTVSLGTTAAVGKRFGRSLLLALAAGFAARELVHAAHHRSPWFTLATFFGVFFVGMMSVRAKVRVGTDGILIRQILRRPRFIPYQAIASATRGNNDVEFGLRSDETVAFAGSDSRGSKKTSATIDALFERIESARALFASHAEIRSHLLSALKRDGRSLAAWRKSATELSREHYRVAATPRDVLETIVQDSAVAPDVRIGAAIALHADSGARVRVGTETSALPELGAAIDAALDGDDPALEKAIATLKLDA